MHLAIAAVGNESVKLRVYLLHLFLCLFYSLVNFFSLCHLSLCLYVEITSHILQILKLIKVLAHFLVMLFVFVPELLKHHILVLSLPTVSSPHLQIAISRKITKC